MIYRYTTDNGEVYERAFRMGTAPHEIKLDDGRVAKYTFATPNIASASGGKSWPMECLGSGVHANQAGELRDHFKRHGVPTEVSKDGNPIYRDAQHRKKALKCRGLVDKSSYD